MEYVDINTLDDEANRLRVTYKKMLNFASTFTQSYLSLEEQFKAGTFGPQWTFARWLMAKCGLTQSTCYRLIKELHRTASDDQREKVQDALREERKAKAQAVADTRAANLAEKQRKAEEKQRVTEEKAAEQKQKAELKAKQQRAKRRTQTRKRVAVSRNKRQAIENKSASNVTQFPQNTFLKPENPLGSTRQVAINVQPEIWNEFRGMAEAEGRSAASKLGEILLDAVTSARRAAAVPR